MKYRLLIRRQKSADSSAYTKEYLYESDGQESLAAVLERLNHELEDPISWECSCMQKKCGACAMLVNGKPRLACDTFLKDCRQLIRLAPLSKFPVVRDLIVDRSVIFQSLINIRLWTLESQAPGQRECEQIFTSSGCLMCGCCLEICPNFSAQGEHAGLMAAVNAYRVLAGENDREHKEQVKEQYRKHFFNTCGKALSCSAVCPAGIDPEDLMVRNNTMAVWR